MQEGKPVGAIINRPRAANSRPYNEIVENPNIPIRGCTKWKERGARVCAPYICF